MGWGSIKYSHRELVKFPMAELLGAVLFFHFYEWKKDRVTLPDP
jgi:hypothetical protein